MLICYLAIKLLSLHINKPKHNSMFIVYDYTPYEYNKYIVCFMNKVTYQHVWTQMIIVTTNSGVWYHKIHCGPRLHVY